MSQFTFVPVTEDDARVMREDHRKLRELFLAVDVDTLIRLAAAANQVDDKQVRTGKITSSADTGIDDANSNPVQWKYQLREVMKNAKGYDAWVDVESGGYVGDAFNMAEDNNSTSGEQGNGVDHDGDDYPEGFDMSAIPDDTLVTFIFVPVEDTFEAWIINVPNGEDGTCAAP
jgi:hypothetical protein